MFKRLLMIFQWKDLIRNMVLRNLKIRYQSSALGFLWTMLNPLLMMGVYFIFISLLRIPINLPELLVGILAWNFFVMCVSDSVNVISGYPSLIKRTYFPKLTFPLSMVLANLINFLLSLLVLAAFLALYAGIIKPDYALRLGYPLLLLPLLIIIQTMLIFGLSNIFSALNVYFKDIQHIVQILLLAWFFLTPVMYTIDRVQIRGETVFHLYLLNPMTSVVVFYRYIFLGKPIPSTLFFYLSLLISPLIFLAGTFFFLKKEPFFADEL